ncbi:MAG: FMN-binding glutamate synthase family protein, partial [Bacteroidia bacterium]
MKNKFIVISVIILAAIGAGGYFYNTFWWAYALAVPLFLLGISDILQTKHSIKHNFPIVGRMRWWAEWLRPKIYQYFIESDTDGAPYNRLSRNVIYQRAKKVNDTTPFGTQLDVYQTGYEWLNHSIAPIPMQKVNHDPRVIIGGP